MSASKYLIKEKNGLFVLAISKQSQNYYVGTVIWYERSGEWAENTLKTDWHTQHFLENSHDEVYEKAIKWVAENLGEPLEIVKTTNT